MLSLILSRWKLIGAVVVAVLLLLGLFAIRDSLSWVPFLKPPAVVKAEAREKVATQQATSNQAGAAINDRRSSNTHTAYQQSEEARRAIQTPDYDAALREYGAGIDRVREAGRAGLSEPDGRGSDAG